MCLPFVGWSMEDICMEEGQGEGKNCGEKKKEIWL